MPIPLFTNNAATALAVAITPTDTVLQITAGTGSEFPSPTGGNYFMLTLVQINNPEVAEIVKCIGRTGDYLTVERGQENTQPQIFNISDNVQLRITAQSLNLFAQGGGGGGGGTAATQVAEFTATQGQTVFTIPFSYVPDNYNLAVFVNGSKQIIDVNYSESSSTSITFFTGLNVGDLVEVIYNLPIAAGQVDASNILYDQGGIGAVESTVQKKLQEMVSVKDFGATGDGTTNDTTAIQNAINYVYTNGKGTLYFPAGVYRVTTLSLNFTSLASINIVGAGRNATIFAKFGSSTTPLFNWDATGFGESYSNFKSFSIDGGAKTFNGINLTLNARFYIDDVEFRNCNYGIYNYGGLLFQVNNCTFKSNNTGYGSALYGTLNETSMVTFNGGCFQGNSLWGADLGGCGAAAFNQVDIESNGTTGSLSTTGAVAIRRDATVGAGYANFAINDCWFEANQGIALYVESSIGAAFITVTNTPFYSTVGGNAITANGGIIEIDSCVAASVADTWFLSCIRSTIRNSTIHTLVDTSSEKYYQGVGGNFATIPFVAPTTYPCAAWANFNGVPSTPAIRESGNIASITKTSAGLYKATFNTAMTSANYCLFGSSTAYSGAAPTVNLVNTTPTYVEFSVGTGGTLADQNVITFAVISLQGLN